MYKGNMGDFVQKVNDYILKNYNCRVIFGNIPVGDLGGYFIAFFAPDRQSAIGYQVYDREDFEQQIYDYVNHQLDHVQGQYDGLYQQSEGLFGEDLSSLEDEDFSPYS
jgi:hypothetical protein